MVEVDLLILRSLGKSRLLIDLELDFRLRVQASFRPIYFANRKSKEMTALSSAYSVYTRHWVSFMHPCIPKLQQSHKAVNIFMLIFQRWGSWYARWLTNLAEVSHLETNSIRGGLWQKKMDSARFGIVHTHCFLTAELLAKWFLALSIPMAYESVCLLSLLHGAWPRSRLHPASAQGARASKQNELLEHSSINSVSTTSECHRGFVVDFAGFS